MLLQNSNEIKLPVLPKHWSTPNNIASFIMLYLSGVHFLKGFSLRCLIQLEKVTSWVTASLMLHEFRGSVMDTWLKWSWTEKPILTNRLFPVICWDTVTGHKLTVEREPLPFPKLRLLLGIGTDVTISGARTS